MRLPALEQRRGGGGNAQPPAPQLLGQHRAAGPAVGQQAAHAAPPARHRPGHAVPEGQWGESVKGSGGGRLAELDGPRMGTGWQLTWSTRGPCMASPLWNVPYPTASGAAWQPPLLGCAPIVTHGRGAACCFSRGKLRHRGTVCEARPSLARFVEGGTVPSSGSSAPTRRWPPRLPSPRGGVPGGCQALHGCG